MMRLDRFLSENTAYSRSEIKDLIRKGQVSVDGKVVKEADRKYEFNGLTVSIAGQLVGKIGKRCFVLYKPAGYVTSTDESEGPNVMELIPEEYRHYGLFPVGRLDKETEGLLIFTNDGELSHRLTSPKYEIVKCYYAEYEGDVTEEDIQAFAGGITLRDGLKCRPSRLEPISPGKAKIYVSEGKYHQVRRMMASRNHKVRYLRRDAEGTINLAGMMPGEFRELTNEEQYLIRRSVEN